MKKDDNLAVVILAAGLGTRMKSDKAKVLHELDGKSILSYVLDTALNIVPEDNIVIVVGHQADAVRDEAAQKGETRFANQTEQNGTGHAVQCALAAIPDSADEVLILCGDVPLLSVSTLQSLINAHRSEGREVTVLSVRLETPTGYGRIVHDAGGNVSKIVEEADASAEEKRIDMVNAGTYCVKKDFLKWALSQISADNAQQEYYLTDIIEIACRRNKRVGALVAENSDEALGINSRDDLAHAEAVIRSGGIGLR